MIHDPFWIYGCNIIVNSLMSFATTWLLAMAGLVILRVKEPRTRSLVLAIPLFKLVIDLFLYNFTDWAILHQVNPLEAEPGTRKLMMWLYLPAATGIQMLTASGYTFTLADLLTLSIDPLWVKAIVSLTAAVSLLLVSRWMVQLFRSLRSSREILAHAWKCQRCIFNPVLSYKVRRARIAIVVSTHVSVPCAMGVVKKTIVFPDLLIDELSQLEFEAVVAHEYGHFRWCDTLVRLLGEFLSAIYWWVPARWCLVRMERLQEYACDRWAINKGVYSIDLAEAIYKAARFAKSTVQPILCARFIDKPSIATRVSAIFAQPGSKRFSILRLVHCLFVAAVMGLVLFGKYWIF